MGCPGGISLIRYTRSVFTRAFRAPFPKDFLEYLCNGKKGRCVVFGVIMIIPVSSKVR